MEKRMLKQYLDMQEEKKDLEERVKRIDARLAGHTAAEAAARKQMEEARKRLDSLLLDLEESIQQVEDSRIRRILRFRYVDGLSWVQVACQMGGKNTADSCRMALKNYLAKKN